MKINEKNLCMFATSPPVDLEGYLTKRGEVNKSWQRRYFVLKGNLLFYFDKKGDKEPLGVIIIEGCTIELSEDGEQYCFQIVFHGINNRTYFLSAESQDQMEQWMKALTCAGYEYMKLMVSELQRQLEEIDGSNGGIPTPENIASAPKPPPRRQNPFNRPAPPIPSSNGVSGNSGFSATPITKVLSSGGGSIDELLNLSSISLTATANNKLVMASGAVTTNPTTVSQLHLQQSSNLIPQLQSAEEFSFQTLHEKFGKEIISDVNEQKRLKELATQPLIVL